MAATLQSSTAGLYNTLCDGLHLSNQQFQMVQGVLPVPTDPAGLYNYIDGIPPQSVAVLYTSNPVNGLNGNMQIVIDRAQPGFLTSRAEQNYEKPAYWVDEEVSVKPIYAPPFEELRRQVNSGASATITFDSATANSDISSSWAKNANYAGVGFWGTKSSSVSESLNAKASSSRIVVRITLNRYAYLQVRPGGWFTQGFFTNQYKNPKNWKDGQQAWDKVFGPSGSCQQVANQVLLVDGYSIATTSYASYSQSDFSMIERSSDTNVWPFYTSSSHSIASQSITLNQDQSITTSIICNPGSLQIFGVGVIPTSTAIGGVVSRRI